MKKKGLLFILIPFVLSTLTSCTKHECYLTYGTLINQDINSLKTLSNEELYDKGFNEYETFLLAVYQGTYSEDCTCWMTFQNTLVSYMNKYHGYVYLFDAQGQDKTLSRFGIDKNNNSDPDFYIFNGYHRIAKYSYKNNKDQKLFSNVDLLNERINKVATKPHLYYVNDDYLKKNLTKEDKSLVLFERRGCGDCHYVLPNVIIPYIYSHDLTKNIWVFDMQDAYELSKSETATDEEKAQYQSLKDYYGLSEEANKTFGYQKGVVPTIQYYENGVVKDTTVFFNDEVAQKEDETFYVSNSFYTEERLVNLSYLKDKSFETVLLNKAITSENVMQTKSGGYYWLQEDAAKYHTPLLEAFLDYYLL